MNEDRVEREDQAILLALEMSSARRPQIEGDDAVETMVRLYTETLGMLAHALEPMAPSPGLKGRLLMTAAGDETQEVKSLAAQRALGGGVLAPAAKPRQRPTTSGLQPGAVAAGLGAAGRRSRWPLRLAAVVSFGLLGLAGWLGWQVQEQSGQLAGLRAEARQAKEHSAELIRLREAVKTLESDVALASSPSVLVCSLRAAEHAPAGSSSLATRAVLYVANDHQHWYFTARGLKESPSGQEYQLWFIANGRPMSGGTFSLKPGEAAHLSSATMPAGTTAVSVTLERKGGSVLPSGPQVLVGDQMQQIL